MTCALSGKIGAWIGSRIGSENSRSCGRARWPPGAKGSRIPAEGQAAPTWVGPWLKVGRGYGLGDVNRLVAGRALREILAILSPLHYGVLVEPVPTVRASVAMQQLIAAFGHEIKEVRHWGKFIGRSACTRPNQRD